MMKHRIQLLWATLLACTLVPASEKLTSGGPLSPFQAAVDVMRYDFDVTIDPQQRTIKGTTQIGLMVVGDDLQKLEWNMVDSLKATQAKLDGQAVRFSQEGHLLWMHLPKTLKKGMTASVSINFQGHPRTAVNPPWDGGFNWNTDKQGNPWIGLSCQGEGGQVWTPIKTHPSDEPDKGMSLKVTVPEGLTVAANGRLAGSQAVGQGLRQFLWETAYPINNYNITINIGKFKQVERTFQSSNGATVPMVYYVLEENADHAGKLLDHAERYLEFYEKFCGPFPWPKDKYGLVETAYLGMEHQTLISYGNRYRYQQPFGEDYDNLLFHEMAHEWWGNQVSVADWADFWIHEGIGTYMTPLYHEYRSGSQKVYFGAIKAMRMSIRNWLPIIPKREASEAEVYQNSDIYPKGAFLMHSLRFLINDDPTFFKMLKDLATGPGFVFPQYASTDKFLKHLAKYSKEDLTPFVQQFLTTTTLPAVQVEAKEAGTYLVSLSNCDFPLDMELLLDGEIKRVRLSQQPLAVSCSTPPVPDPNGWFLLDTQALERANRKKAKKFLADYRKDPGTKALANGILYRELKPGHGNAPSPDSLVRLHIKAHWMGGPIIFDTTQGEGPQQMPASVPVFPSVGELITAMKPGATWEIVAPAGTLPDHPMFADTNNPGTPLILEIQLVDTVNTQSGGE